MIVVNVRIESSAEDIDAMKAAITAAEAASRNDPGCEDYTFSVELNNPNVIRITERWTTLEDLKAHLAAPHLATFREAMASHPPKSSDAHFYEVEEIPFPG
jgi:quinol monooxygenase YgiN